MLIKSDIDLLLSSGRTFQEFDGSKITILGGTGFIGQWLVQALREFENSFGFAAEISVITRDMKAARALFANFDCPTPEFIEFDFATGSIDLDISDFFVNGATPSRKITGLENSDAVYTSTVNASESIIRSAIKHGNRPRILNLSSGIVYGPQDLNVSNQTEGPISLKPDSRSGYLNAKLASEAIFSESVAAGIANSISPRLFAFMGPGIALNEHFAVGNFLRDGLNGEPIAIQGSPSTMRSYLYPTDLVIWILSALLNPKDLNVNIGSEMPVNMLELASLISDMTSKKGVRVVNDDKVASCYVPATAAFRDNYGVSETVNLETGLAHWIEWLTTSKRG
jgi:dTDP-glucose 4,6-dehydratase